ncbi:Sestrin-like protein isoform X1 [Oopsacas minuta]|uniref:Sestrin-like protein isoform X1 n=1 Tax=Oopsacas minuta TaxID=111878 RepID=A0AAV7JVL6_9METZ|nr:Sestrin-like protein isoform X1 [Oopsacas minuta]
MQTMNQDQLTSLLSSMQPTRNSKLDSLFALMQALPKAETADEKERLFAEAHDKFLPELSTMLYRLKNSNYDKSLEEIKKVLESKYMIPTREYDQPSNFFQDTKHDTITQGTHASDSLDPYDFFLDAFDMESRVSNLVYMLGYHPKFLSIFLEAHKRIMYGNSVLSQSWRHYIAIMAAASQGCLYLVTLEELNFLNCKGPVLWLEGLENIPTKLKKLQEVNRILVSAPWKLEKKHITQLVDDPVAENRWSFQQIVHAFLILSRYHSLSQLALGCGIKIESDHPLSKESVITSKSIWISKAFPDMNVAENLVANLKKIDSEINCHETDVEKEFINLATRDPIKPPPELLVPHPYLRRYLCEKCLLREEFTPEEGINDELICRASEYNWLEHGYTLLQNMCQDSTEKIVDDEFQIGDDLTYGKVGPVACDNTQEIRVGLKRYTQCLLGHFYEDYKYKNITELLKDFRLPIKLITYYPFLFTRADFERLNPFEYTEKIHINIIMMEGRQKAELLYALRPYREYS